MKRIAVIVSMIIMGICMAGMAHAYDALFNEDWDGGTWLGVQSPGIDAWQIEDNDGASSWAIWDEDDNFANSGHFVCANSDYYNEAFDDTLWSPVINTAGYENIHLGAYLYWEAYYAEDNGYILLKKSNGDVVELDNFDENYNSALDNGTSWVWEDNIDAFLDGEALFQVGFRADLMADSYYFQVDDVYVYGDAATVPVPGTMLILALGLLGLSGLKRK